MLKNINWSENKIQESKEFFKKNNIEVVSPNNPCKKIIRGVYWGDLNFNHTIENLSNNKIDPYSLHPLFFEEDISLKEKLLIWENNPNDYGVADNIEQILEYYKDQIEHPKDEYCISITPIYQDKANKGKGGGWRWHKWGEYIGTRTPLCEYLDDESIEFPWVYVFHIYKFI